MKLKKMDGSLADFYLGLSIGLFGMWWILYQWGIINAN
jgi:hypothetical protein|tara:strand:+ start:1747 stop:1860 length:114 start_codon:yes stop_codon:yes gene_type:complete